VVVAAPAPAPAPAVAARAATPAPEAPKQRRARGGAAARGGAIKLAPGSLADPALAPTPEPAHAPQPAAEPAQAVFTQDPILPQRSERAPRKRTGTAKSGAKSGGKKAVANTSPAAASRISSPLPEGGTSEDGILDTLNVGPVANRRRTQI
jgi:hypothetical protein